MIESRTQQPAHRARGVPSSGGIPEGLCPKEDGCPMLHMKGRSFAVGKPELSSPEVWELCTPRSFPSFPRCRAGPGPGARVWGGSLPGSRCHPPPCLAAQRILPGPGTARLSEVN